MPDLDQDKKGKASNKPELYKQPPMIQEMDQICLA